MSCGTLLRINIVIFNLLAESEYYSMVSYMECSLILCISSLICGGIIFCYVILYEWVPIFLLFGRCVFQPGMKWMVIQPTA
jgi:hypothetical protein